MLRGKTAKYLLITALISVSFIVFIENFVYSSDFAILSLRGTDEVAFQISLHRYHECEGSSLLCMNDYGYGWIYWFPVYLITYPAYLLFEATGVSWLLIVLPRMYSLLFCIMCSILCYKIISIYTKNEWIKMAVVLMMPLFPAGCEWAGRFSTVPQVAFFSMLSIYLVAKNEVLDRKRLRYALLAFAIAMATKVSAVVTGPLLVLLVLARYHWKFSWVNIKVWLQESLLAVVIMIVLMCPIVVFAPMYPEEAKASIDILLYYWTNNQGAADIFYNFKRCIMFTNFKGMAVLLNICLLLLILQGIIRIKKEGKKIIYWDYILLPIGYYIGTFYLYATIGSGIMYVFMYSTAISFVLPFGVLLLENMESGKRKGELCIRLVTILCCWFQISFMGNAVQKNAAYNIFAYYQNGMQSKERVENIRNMEKAVEELGMSEVNCYVDHGKMCNFYNAMEHDNVGLMEIVWDDWGNRTNNKVNLLALSKDSVGFYEDEMFEAVFANAEPQQQESMIADRRIRQELIEYGKFLDLDWELVYEDGDSYIFVRIDS